MTRLAPEVFSGGGGSGSPGAVLCLLTDGRRAVREWANGIRIAGAGKRHGQKNSGRQGDAQGCPVSGCMIDKPEKRGMLLI